MSQIILRTSTSEERFADAADVRLVPFLAAAVRDDSTARRAALNARVKLGSLLWQLRDQVVRGEWSAMLGRLAAETSLHRTSLLNSLKLASKFANEAGELSDEKWRQRQADIVLARGMNFVQRVGRSEPAPLPPRLAATLAVSPDKATMRQAVELAHDSQWENEPMGVELSPEEAKELELAMREQDLGGDSDDGDDFGYDEEADFCEAPESGEDVPAVEAGQSPLVIGKQFTLESWFAAVSKDVTEVVRRATTEAPASVAARVDQATQRYLAEVSAICTQPQPFG